MTRPLEAMPETIRAAKHVRRSVRPQQARRKADDLLQALAAIECNFAVAGPAGIPAGLLRDMVIITGDLVGRSWPRPNAEEAAAFAALYAPLPPPLTELDHILARALLSRFGQQLPMAAADDELISA